MSHYRVAVFTEREDHAGYLVDSLLAPYDESLDVEPYLDLTREQLIEYGYKRLITKPDPPMVMDDETCYNAAIEYFDPEPENIGEDGGLYSTYNPNSKWDYYTSGLCERVRDLDFEGDDDWKAVTYAVVMPDGDWIAPGTVGWFGWSTESEDQWELWRENFYNQFWKPAIEQDWWVTVVDCHI